MWFFSIFFRLTIDPRNSVICGYVCVCVCFSLCFVDCGQWKRVLEYVVCGRGSKVFVSDCVKQFWGKQFPVHSTVHPYTQLSIFYKVWKRKFCEMCKEQITVAKKLIFIRTPMNVSIYNYNILYSISRPMWRQGKVSLNKTIIIIISRLLV